MIFALAVVIVLIPRLEAQPIITQQPTNQMVAVGSNTTFIVSATGTAPISYQWYFNNTNTPWSSAVAYAQTLNGFVYSVVVTYGGQGYTVEPQVRFVGGGGSGAAAYASISNRAVSSINVSNTGAGYTNLPVVQIDPPNGLMPGQTNSFLNISNITINDVGDYWCVITNASGSITSSVALFKLAASILTQPQSQIVWAGRSVTFTVTPDASGPYSYYWKMNGNNIAGATGDSFSIPTVSTNDAGVYTVLVSNQNSSVLSRQATLGVDWISQQPGNQIATNGDNIRFNVAANGPDIFSYQWQFNGTNVSLLILNIPPIITTVAGNGTNGYSGDGGAATSARINYPNGATVDSAGNLYIADRSNNRIRKVGTNGIITTVAGNGTTGYSGDGGAATNAMLYFPCNLTADGAGNIYIADTGNGRIRKVGTNGIITTVAGNGYSGDGGAATNARLKNPQGLTIDNAGILYIADTDNQRIRKVGTNGIITTVAGNGTNGYSGDGGAATNAMLNYPHGLSVDSKGILYIADTGNGCIRKVGTNGIITSVVGNGTNGYSGDGDAATNAMLNYHYGVTVDGADNLYIADTSNNRIRKVGTNGIITTVAGNGTTGYSGDGGIATNAMFYNPYDVTADGAGNLYIADTGNGRIRKVGRMQGGTQANLYLINITSNNIGNYQVIITASGGSITSSVAILNLAYPPSINLQPQSATATIGGNIQFSVLSTGTAPFGYQWFIASTIESNATATPIVINGFVLGANMTSSGSGYLAVPGVQFVGGSGNGANGYAVVSNRMVTAINMNSAGSGYTTPPTIQIAAPAAISLINQTNSLLTLASVTSTNAGKYFVVVTNNFGSVTSSVANLIIAPVGYNFITGPIMSGDKMQLSFIGLAGTNYALDRSYTLSPANWVPVVTNPADVNGVLVFTNTPDSATNNFWRIRSVP